jgi:hypothetical protein
MFEDELQALVDKYHVEEIEISYKKTITLKPSKRYNGRKEEPKAEPTEADKFAEKYNAIGAPRL